MVAEVGSVNSRQDSGLGFRKWGRVGSGVAGVRVGVTGSHR